jgi:undecaprenyl-diphosphatase
MQVWVRLSERLDAFADLVLRWDERALWTVSDHPTLRRFSRLFLLATYLGDGYLWGGLGLGLILFGRPVDRLHVLVGLGVTIVNVAAFRFLKLLVGRARPVTLGYTLRSRAIDTHSFPSGHATTSFGLAWVVLSTYSHVAVGVSIYLIAATIAFSRVYVREHYPLDVLCGALLGSLVSVCFIPFFRWLLF